MNHNHDSKWTSEVFNNLYDLIKEKPINDEVVVNCNQMQRSNMNLKGPSKKVNLTVPARKDVPTKPNAHTSSWQKVDGQLMEGQKKTPVEMRIRKSSIRYVLQRQSTHGALKHKAPPPPIPTRKHRSLSHEDLTEHSKHPYPSIFAIANLKMQIQ